MGLNCTIRLYKGCNRRTFRCAIESAAKRIGGAVEWNQIGHGVCDLRLGERGDVQSLEVQYQPDEFMLCKEIGLLLQLPWIELRIQEGSIWDYSLFKGNDVLDNFSVCPQYWEGEGVQLEYQTKSA